MSFCFRSASANREGGTSGAARAAGVVAAMHATKRPYNIARDVAASTRPRCHSEDASPLVLKSQARVQNLVFFALMICSFLRGLALTITRGVSGLRPAYARRHVHSTILSSGGSFKLCHRLEQTKKGGAWRRSLRRRTQPSSNCSLVAACCRRAAALGSNVLRPVLAANCLITSSSQSDRTAELAVTGHS